MISVLMASLADNSFLTKLRTFVQPSLLVIDEVGYLPVPKDGANFLFQVVAKRYETGSIASSLHDVKFQRISTIVNQSRTQKNNS